MKKHLLLAVSLFCSVGVGFAMEEPRVELKPGRAGDTQAVTSEVKSSYLSSAKSYLPGLPSKERVIQVCNDYKYHAGIAVAVAAGACITYKVCPFFQRQVDNVAIAVGIKEKEEARKLVY